MKLCPNVFYKNSASQKIANEQGSVLIIALMLMAVLAILGVVASNTSITEMRVASNEQSYNQTFYAADGGWQEAPAILNRLIDDAPESDATTKIVDLSAMDTTVPNKINNIPYTYEIKELSNRPAPGTGDNYVEFQYQVDTTTYDPNDTTKEKQKIRVVVNKIFKKGYGND